PASATQSSSNSTGWTALKNLDPPDHTRLRRIASDGFTPRRVEALRSRIEAVAEDLVSDLGPDAGPADMVGRLALPLPMKVMCELLAIPYEDREFFRACSDPIVSIGRYSRDQVSEAYKQMTRYFGQLIDQRRDTPGDDLISGLVRDTGTSPNSTDIEIIGLAV